MKVWVWAAMWAAGCGGPTEGAGTDGPTAPGSTEPFAGAPVIDIVGGCPDVGASGAVHYKSNGLRRDLILKIPAGGGEGKPVMFFWHGLGGSADLFDLWLDFQTFADDNDMVVVAPDSLDPFLNTWTLGEGDDLDMYDHLRACLSRDLNVDLNRVYAAGFSFGGLFTTAVLMNRADTLAAALPMSGGTSSLWFPYTPLAADLPVLVMWGGPSDTYGSGLTYVNFEEMSLDLSANLQADGHPVHHCDHGLGHDLPAEWDQITAAWFGGHTFGQAANIEGGDYPGFCSSP